MGKPPAPFIHLFNELNLKLVNSIYIEFDRGNLGLREAWGKVFSLYTMQDLSH
jgi:hypothetical protein